MNNRWIVSIGFLAAAALALLAGCASGPAEKECAPGQVVWEKGTDPARDGPGWIHGGKAAYKEVGVRKADVPSKFLVFVGVSEDKNNDRGAQFNGVEDMLKRYAYWLQEELDELLPQAAREAKATLPAIDTALGAYNAVIYLPRENAPFIRVMWQAKGFVCDTGEPVYRAYVLGLFDRETRRAHLLEAAKETFKHSLIKAEVKEDVLKQFERLARKL